MYTLVGTLNGHGDSITAAQFSPNGAYLASGSEDGLLLIHSVGDWKPLLRFVDASPITSLVWHPSIKRLLFCGCKSGDVHMIKFSASVVRSHSPHDRIAALIDVQNSARCPCVDRWNAGPNTVSDTPHWEELGRPWVWQRRIPGRV